MSREKERVVHIEGDGGKEEVLGALLQEMDEESGRSREAAATTTKLMRMKMMMTQPPAVMVVTTLKMKSKMFSTHTLKTRPETTTSFLKSDLCCFLQGPTQKRAAESTGKFLLSLCAIN